MPSPANLADLECNLEQLAALVGVTPRHCRRFLVDAPKTSRGRWALGQALPAILEALSGGPAGGDLTKERTRLVGLQADRAALQLARERGEVALLSEVQNGWARAAAITRTNVMNVAQRAAPQLLGEGNEAVFKQCLRAELALALQQSAEALITETDFEDDFSNDDEF